MGFSVAIDVLILGRPAVPVPADKTTLSPPKLKRNFDVRNGFGVDGAFCTYTGQGLATFDVTFEFWSEEKEKLWNAWASVNLAPPSRIPLALGIYHPVLVTKPFAITGVQATEVEGWSLITPGRWQTRLSLLEYRPQKQFAPQKTEPAVPAVSKAPPAKPKTEQDIRMQAAAARLQASVDAGKK